MSRAARLWPEVLSSAAPELRSFFCILLATLCYVFAIVCVLSCSYVLYVLLLVLLLLLAVIFCCCCCCLFPPRRSCCPGAEAES